MTSVFEGLRLGRGFVFGLIVLATQLVLAGPLSDFFGLDPKPPRCAIGEIRGRQCYLGKTQFCSEVKASELFPGLFDCRVESFGCRGDECLWQVVDAAGEVKVGAFAEFQRLGNDYVFGKSPKTWAGLYSSQGEMLISSSSQLWRCESLQIKGDEMICDRKVDILSLDKEMLAQYHSQQYDIADLMEFSEIDLCTVAKKSPRAFLQFWSSRYYIGETKYPVHITRNAQGHEVCRLADLEAKDCSRLWVDRRGVVCSHGEGTERVLSLDLTNQRLALHLRDWMRIEPATITGAEIEKLVNQGLLRIENPTRLLLNGELTFDE